MDKLFLGLSKNPFNPLPRGAEVFIGPQTAALVKAFSTALTPRGAIAVVAGPVGTGKTTLVNYALDALYKKRKIVRVGRSPMRAQDVLESLLIVLGVENRPNDREPRLLILSDALRQYAAAGLDVIVLVEDALGSGGEVLAELAALTAPETGDTAGARMVLMGPDSLAQFMQRPELAGLQSRISLRHDLNPLSAAETRGYLLHCFRTAGGDFKQLFAPACSELLHGICDGNPRAINQVTEVALRTADELGLNKVSARFLAEVAARIYDPETREFRFAKGDAETIAPEDNSLAAKPDAADAGGADKNLRNIEQDIMRAESLEDLDDIMAETLFGEELSELAEQAVANNN